MLSEDLYILSDNLFKNISYEKFPQSNDFLDKNILYYLNSKQNFIRSWLNTLNLNCKNIKSNFKYSIVEQNSKLMKIILYIQTNFSSYNINSCCIDSYILVLEYTNNSYKIIYLISKEDTPLLYFATFKTPLKYIYSLTDINSYLKEFWDDKYKNLSNLHSSFSELNYSTNRAKTNFNIDLACSYAETYALTPNPEFKDFTDLGGDCTNYVSQILNVGGLKTNKVWHPYSNTWIRVKELYDYLVNNNIAHPLPNNSGLDKGCVIQFLIPSTNRFSHTGFITYNIPYVDYLYCCHSYNKLNYPLSLIYPVRYKSMRSLVINI